MGVSGGHWGHIRQGTWALRLALRGGWASSVPLALRVLTLAFFSYESWCDSWSWGFTGTHGAL